MQVICLSLLIILLAALSFDRFATRLVDIKENSKFKSSGSDAGCDGLHEFIDTIKGKYGLK